MLIGNAFPLALIAREVNVKPVALVELRAVVREAALDGTLESYWGHANTLAAASKMVGVDLAPATERPALRLDAEGLPTLDPNKKGENIVYVLSPRYRGGFRPQIGQEVQAQDIQGWQALKVSFI